VGICRFAFNDSWPHTISVGFDYRRWVQKRDLSNDFLGNSTSTIDTISQNGGGCAQRIERLRDRQFGCGLPASATQQCSTFQPDRLSG